MLGEGARNAVARMLMGSQAEEPDEAMDAAEEAEEDVMVMPPGDEEVMLEPDAYLTGVK